MAEQIEEIVNLVLLNLHATAEDMEVIKMPKSNSFVRPISGEIEEQLVESEDLDFFGTHE